MGSRPWLRKREREGTRAGRAPRASRGGWMSWCPPRSGADSNRGNEKSREACTSCMGNSEKIGQKQSRILVDVVPRCPDRVVYDREDGDHEREDEEHRNRLSGEGQQGNRD